MGGAYDSRDHYVSGASRDHSVWGYSGRCVRLYVTILRGFYEFRYAQEKHPER